MALAYKNVEGIEKNEELAITHINIAIDKGSAAAITALGMCYLHGEGVPKDELNFF
jgi:TPR repeat protein